MANALVDAGAKLGPGLSTLLGGLTVDAYGWRAMFLFAGLGSLFWLAPWLLIAESDSPASRPSEPRGPGWGQLLRCRQVWGTSVGMFALGYVLYFLLSWLPSYLVSERGFSMTTMAVLGSIPFWGMAVSSALGGWSSDRWIRGGADPGKVRTLYAAGGLVLCATAILPAPLVTSSTTSVVLITAACMFLGLFTSNVWAISQTLAGHAAGKWTGIQNAIGNLGGVVSPLLTGWLVSETGSFSLAFIAAAMVLISGAAVYVLTLGRMKPVDWSGGAPANALTA